MGNAHELRQAEEEYLGEEVVREIERRLVHELVVGGRRVEEAAERAGLPLDLLPVWREEKPWLDRLCEEKAVPARQNGKERYLKHRRWNGMTMMEIHQSIVEEVIVKTPLVDHMKRYAETADPDDPEGLRRLEMLLKTNWIPRMMPTLTASQIQHIQSPEPEKQVDESQLDERLEELRAERREIMRLIEEANAKDVVFEHSQGAAAEAEDAGSGAADEAAADPASRQAEDAEAERGPAGVPEQVGDVPGADDVGWEPAREE